MSVRRTVAQSSAGLLLLAAFAAGPSAVYAEPGDPSDGGGGEQPSNCEMDPDYVPVLAISASEVAPGDTVTLTVTCLPERGPITAKVVPPGGAGDDDPEGGGDATPGGEQTWTYTVPEDAENGDIYSFVLSMQDGWNDNRTFTVVVEDNGESGGDNGSGGDEGGGDNGSGESGGSDDSESGSGEGGDGGDDSAESGENGDGSEDTGQEQGGDDQNSDNDEVVDGGSDTEDSGSDDDQKQDTEDKGRSDDTEDSEEEQEGGDTTASDSPTKHVPGDEEDGDTSASAANGNAASRGSAPAQPPAAPGSATNDFPAAPQETTADHKQSAALAVLMTKLFASGVSSGSVGTTPDQARTVIDPSADASEIEVPAGSDTGGSSDDGSGSESSDGDALAATGSNMLVPAGIAATAILLGAGLKIHQLRRGL